MKKGKQTTAKATPRPRSLQSKGKPADRKKFSVKSAAVAFLAGGDSAGVKFTYQWKRNDRVIPEATTNILKNIPLKRWDRISVVATAYHDGVAGPPLESQPLVVYGLPPTLEMKIVTSQVRLGQPFEIQLTGTSPDGDKVVYSLISPFIDGMAVDANTGKIM